MFEGWASDLLAAYLGQILEVQREQLRISLWSAWRTGLTLENVALRADAFDHLQLPFKLHHGSVGRMTAQIPWRAHRSPVVLELADVEICLRLLGPADLAPHAAAARSAVAKQVLIAAEELQAVAGGIGPEVNPKQGGMLISLVRHAISMLLKRLRLTVQNIHVRVEDPCSGRAFGLRLGELRTCEPGEINAYALWPSGDYGEGTSPGGCGGIQKHFSAMGIQAYWIPGSGADEIALEQGGQWDILKPTAVDVSLSTDLSGAGSLGARVRLEMLPLQVRSSQAIDMTRCSDDLQWLTARARYAHLRPEPPYEGVASGFQAKSMWQYAVNAVLQGIRGPVKAAKWQLPEAVQHARRRYVLLYRKKLELEKEAQVNPSKQKRTSELEDGWVPPQDGMTSENTPPTTQQAPTTTAPTLSPIGEQQLLDLEQELSVADIISCRATASHAVVGTSRPQSAAAEGDNNAGMSRRGVSWGVAKAASFLGYVPRPFSAGAGLPHPSDSEVKELCEAIQFNPEEEQEEQEEREQKAGDRSASAAGTEPDGGGEIVKGLAAAGDSGMAGHGTEFSVGCLIEAIHLDLLSPDGDTQATVTLDELTVKAENSGGGSEGTTVTARLNGAIAQDWVSHGPGVSAPLLLRGHVLSSQSDVRKEEGGNKAPPLLSMKFAVQRRTLDVMVQPLKLHAAPACFQALASFSPPLDPETYPATCMRAVNALSLEARASIKADRLRHLGRSLNLVLKIIDVEVVLPSEAGTAGPGQDPQHAALRTGEIIAHNIGLAELSDDATRVYSVLDSLLGATKEINAGARHELTAAAAVVEERLVYQSLEFCIAGVHLLCPFTAPDEAGHATALHPVKVAGSLRVHRIPEDFGVPQVLCSLHIDQIVASLSPALLRQISRGLDFTGGGNTSGSGDVVPVAEQPTPERPWRGLGPAHAIIDVRLAGADVSYTIEPPLPATPRESPFSPSPLVAIHMRASLRSSTVSLTAYASGVAAKVNIGGLLIRDLTYDGGVLPGANGALPRLASRLAVEGAHVSTSPAALPGGAHTVEVQLIDISAFGFDEEPGNFISRVHEQQPTHINVTIATSLTQTRTAVAVSNVATGHATILRIAALFGLGSSGENTAEEDGSASDSGATVFREPAAMHSTNGYHNKTPPPPAHREHHNSGPGPNLSIELHDCRILWKFQQAASAGCHMPAALHDFLLLHEDIATLEIPHFYLQLPLLLEPSNSSRGAHPSEASMQTAVSAAPSSGGSSPGTQTPSSSGVGGGGSTPGGSNSTGGRPLPSPGSKIIFARGLCLNVATVGYPGRPVLPLLQVPLLTLGPNADCISGGAGLQKLQLSVPNLDLGVHPSHFTTAAAAWQLVQQELALVARDPADVITDGESIVTSNSTANQELPPTLSRTLTAPRTGEEVSETDALSPPTTTRNQSPFEQPWQVDVSLGALGISVVGSMPSSTCLKLEWHRVISRISGTNSTSTGRPSLAASLAWHDLSLHELQPKAGDDLIMDNTPFPSGMLHSADGYGSPLAPSTNNSVFRGGQGTRPVRRSLSTGLGLAGAAVATDSPQGSVGFQAPAPYMMARFSASSAVSRYFSAADSEFEDATSEVPDGSRSPPAIRSPRPPLLPLDISSAEYDACLLVRLSSSADEDSGGAGLQGFNMTARQCGHRIELGVEALTLRVYLHGWENAVECANIYQAFASRAHRHILAARESSEKKAQQPRTDSSLQTTVSRPSVHVTLRLAGIALEAIAAPGSLSEVSQTEQWQRRVPVGSVTVHMEASFHAGSDGGRAIVRIPGALLSVGSVPAGGATGALALNSRDALIGARDIELSASTRVGGDGSAQHIETAAGAAVAEPSSKVVRLDAKVQQVSLWASQHNLSSAAALVQHFSHMAAHTRQLQSMHHGHHDVKPAVPAAKPAVATTCIEVAVGINTLTALLHNVQPGRGGSLSPLFELAVTDLVVVAARLGNSSALTGDVSLQVELDVFNLRKLAWESCIDPWPVDLKFALPIGSSISGGERGGYDGQRSAASQHTRLDVHSLSGLEATVTSTVADAAASVGAMMRYVSAVALEPDTLPRDTDAGKYKGAAAAAAAGSLSTAYQLRNLTGATLEVWLAEPLAGGVARPPLGPPQATVPSSATAALPVLELQNSECSGRKSGRPSSSLGVLHDFVSSGDLDSPQNNERHRRTLMYFRIAGEGPLEGPVYLDRPEAALHSVQVGQPSDPAVSSAGIVSETIEVGLGAFAATLHSGLCLKNTTGIALEIGLQTPLGSALGEPHVLGMLSPDETTWLPVLRPDTAGLCARPCQSYRPHTLPRLPLAFPPKPGGITTGPRLPTSTLGTSGVVYRSTSHLTSPQRSSAADLHGPSTHRFEWSPSIQLGQLLPPSQQPSRESIPQGPFPRHVSCAPTAEQYGLPLILSVGALPIGAPGTALEITLGPPLVVHNALPVPMDITLRPKWSPPVLLHLGPTEQAAMLHLEASAIESVAMRPDGYQHTPELALAALGPRPGEEAVHSFWKSPASTSSALDAAAAAAAAAVSSQHNQQQQPGGQREIWAAPDAKATLHELGPGRSTVDVVVRHGIDHGSGTHMLRVACPLWVYNCTGVPIALRSPIDAGDTLGLGMGLPDDSIAAVEDEVPESWVPPLLLPAHGGVDDGGTRSGAQSPSLTATPRPGALAAREPSIGAVVPALPGVGSGLRGVVAGQRNWPLGRHQSEVLASARSAPAAGPLSARSNVPLSTARSSVAGSVLSMGRSASVADAPGLSEILDTPRQDGRLSPSPSPGGGRSVLGMQRAASRARGIADSMDTAPTFERPSLWPSMSSSLVAAGANTAGHHVRLQLRAAAAKAPPGRSYWTQELDIDASGGAAVASLPAPPPAVGAATASAGLSSMRHRGAYPVVVTAIPVPGADGALALCVAPRYVLRNLLDSPIQYKQQGAGGERELSPGGVRAVRWSDIGLPPRLSVRVQEAGWMWSGGFALDVPGDLFVKIRHRDRGVTMLVRVDVATTDAGIVQITLSHNPSGFAPYRVENCSLETLNARQRGVHEQQDVLRPYCSLNYAWDEPALPHALVLELPGARHIGTFQLDEVGQDVLLHVRTRRGDPERCLRVVIRAEGPTRVLTVMDPLRHTLTAPPLPFPSQPAAAATTPLNLVATAPAPLPNALNPATDSSAGLLWEISLDLASAGVSLVGPEHEVAYFRLTGTAARVAVSAARTALSIQVRGVQLDNPTPWVAYPVALRLPAPFSKLTSSVAAAVELHPAPALAVRLSVWHRRPAGVLCVEVAEAEVRSVAIYVDQEHAEEMAAVVGRVMARAHLASGQWSSPSLLGGSGNGAARPESVLGNGNANGNGIVAGQDAGGLLGDDVEGDVTPSPAASPATSVRIDVGGARAASPFFNGRLPDLPQLRDLLALGEAADGTHSTAHSNGVDAPLGPPIGHQKIYLDLLSLSPVEVTLSFMSSPVHHPAISHPRLAALQRLLALADVEDARLWLAGLRLANPLMDAPALAQALQRHYVRALIPELFKIVGAASVFGDPVSLLHHLGLGVWAFVSAPAAGLVESARRRGPRQFILGVLSGTRGLFSNVIYAVSNAATKASGAARKAIVVWGLDRQDEPLGAGSFRRRVMWAEGEQGGGGPDGGLLAAVLRGAVGLLTEPIRGAEEGGLPGLARGIQRGALGAVALPLASLLEMCARTADSVRRAVAGSSNVGWLRPPRHVSTSEPLAPYDWSQAMGRWLLRELDRAEAQRAQRRRGPAPDTREEFALCSPAGQTGCYLVLTSRRVVYVRAHGLMWEPVVLWQAHISDLESVASMEDESLATVRFVAHPPPRPLWLGRRWGGGGLGKSGVSSSFFSFLSVECADADAAARVRGVAERSMASTARRVQSAGYGLIVDS